ncbi:MAG: septum formation initiator family protein [Clostridia bacterium]|nr:septum formation initiator family protein [Clostridia bacterium]
MTNTIKRDKKKLFCRAIVFIAVAYFAFNIISQQFQLAYYRAQRQELAAQIEQQQERYHELEEEAKLYNTDEYIERTARTRLGLVRADETVFAEIGK